MSRFTTKTFTAEESGAFVEELRIAPTGSGPLNGFTFAVKDLIDLKGHVTGCGNPRWRDTHPPAAAHAVCVEQILAAGAVCLGKTVTDELAFGLDGENIFYGTPLNPRAPDRVPGGSSSGSASAVACNLVDFALGTDTGGSVRVPASNCGLFGLRPTHDRISLAGVNPLALSFDTLGVLAGSAEVLARAAAVLLAVEVPESAEVGAVHILKEPLALVDAEVREALEKPLDGLARRLAGRLRETSLNAVVGEAPDAGLQTWYETFITIQWAEIWSSLGPWVEAVKPDLGPRVRQNFDRTRTADRRRVGAAARCRENYFHKVKNFLGPRDLLVLPTVPAPAPKKGSLEVDRTQGNYYPRALSLTAVSGVARLPQVSLPLAQVGSLPVGLSLMAAHGEDAFLLAVVRALAMN
jgi:amidase